MECNLEDIMRGLKWESRLSQLPNGDLKNAAKKLEEARRVYEDLLPRLIEFGEEPATLGDLASFLTILREELYWAVCMSNEIHEIKLATNPPAELRRRRRGLRP